MEEEEEQPTLLRLSRQLWDIHQELGAYEDCVAECLKEDYWTNEEFLDDDEGQDGFAIKYKNLYNWAEVYIPTDITRVWDRIA
ncbi:hypothetical protein ES703_71258 [subsurface metagenome]